jgi:hypothetical protein
VVAAGSMNMLLMRIALPVAGMHKILSMRPVS